MIKEVLLKKQVLHFHQPFKITYETAEQDEIVFLKLIDDQGRFGLASASCDRSVIKETPQQLYGLLRKKLTKDFFEWPAAELGSYHKKIQQVFKNRPTAQTAVETALLNLWANQRRVSLWEYFGGQRKSCLLAYSIGIKSLPKTLAEVSEKVKEGYRIIKLKGGLNLTGDINKILTASQKIPENCKLLLDVNHGYSPAQAAKLIQAVKGSKLALIEQPVKADDWASLKTLTAYSPIPIIADESAVSPKDCQKLLTGGYVHGVNIKLMKCGGPFNFLEIYRLAKKLDKIVMIGCMYESVASLTVSAQLALGLDIDYVDLDSGPIDFYDDPVKGGVVFKKGRLLLGQPLTSDLWPN